MLNRRSVLAGLGGVALAGTLRPARALVGSPTGTDLGNRRDLLTALAKMRGATDERLCIGYVVGARYAVPVHKAIPMMGILAGTFSQYRRISDDAFDPSVDDRILALSRPDGSPDLAAVARFLARDPRRARLLARLGKDLTSATSAAVDAALDATR